MQAEFDAQAADLTAVQEDLTATQAELEEARRSLEEGAAALAAAESSLSDAEARAAEAESALDEELNRPWPENMKALFVAGCAESPDEGLTFEQQETVCSCIVDELEQSFGLVDFLLLSMATIDPNVETSPITGLPIGMDPEFIDGVASAATRCILEL